MKYILFVTLLFFNSVTSVGQSLLDLNKKFVESFQQGKYEEAILYAEKAFNIAKKELSEDHPDYVTNLENLGWVYLTAGYYSKAEPIYQELIIIKGRLLGKDHPDYAKMVNNLGVLYFYMGDYIRAEPLYTEAMNVRKKALGENDPDYATSLDNLGALFAAVGVYEKAETFYKQAMAIREKVRGKTDGDYTTSLNNLASLYLSMGEYAKAEPLYLQASLNRKKTLGENSPDYATSQNNLGALYLAIGQYEKAEELFSQAMDIRQRVLGENHPSYSVSTNNLSQVYAATGQYKKAINLCIQTINLRKKILGENHPDYATSLNNLAILYAETGEYKKAEPYCIQAAAIRKKIFGENHADYAASLNNQALISKNLGEYKKAEALFIKARDIYKKTEGEQSPAYTISLDNLSILYLTTGEYAKAEPINIASTGIILKNIISTFAVLSEKEKGNYLNSNSSVTEINNSLLYHYPQASTLLKKNNFNLQIVLKSLSLADTKNMIAAVRNNKDSTVKKLFNNWKIAKNFLAKQYSLPSDSRLTDLREIESQTEELEKELSRKSVNFRNQQSAFSISMKEVQQNLQAEEAAIEFVSFHLYTKHWTDSLIYAAYILKKNDPEPRFVVLCEEKQLQKIFDSAGKTATSMVNSFYRGLEVKNKPSVTLGKELYKLVWQPLEPYLKGIKKISYSPAGKLFSVAFHALTADSGQLLMDKYQLQQYTSIRQIALRNNTGKTVLPGSIALFGDPEYTMDSLELVRQRKNYSINENNPATTKIVSRSTDGTGWSALPGTAEEVKKIGDLFLQNKITPKIFTQIRASEENLKILDGKSPQVIHIATHGFFLPTTVNDKKKDRDFNRQNSFTLSDDPLLRSGLMLAGGNYAWSGKKPVEGIEDGVVTAYEISQINLSNTELIVLSACETALGDVKGSEGVFGLQRAFKMAGVKKMIVSLWQVPDKETAELMTTFYTYWMKGKTINEAFTQAQADMRKNYAPFYWAAFVLVE